MLYLVIGPSAVGKSTLIAARLAARGLGTEHTVLAQELVQLDPASLVQAFPRGGVYYVHFATWVRPEALSPDRRRIWDLLVAVPLPKRALIMVCDTGELLRRVGERAERGWERAAAYDRSRLATFDPARFRSAWAAELSRCRIAHRVIETTTVRDDPGNDQTRLRSTAP